VIVATHERLQSRVGTPVDFLTMVDGQNSKQHFVSGQVWKGKVVIAQRNDKERQVMISLEQAVKTDKCKTPAIR